MNDKIIKIINPKDGYINIPLELTFDFEGREDAINAYEAEIVKDIVNSPQDYEITKFAHSTYTVGLGPFINNAKTSINYQFYFYDFLNDVTASTVSNWAIDYQNASFTDNEIYYFANSFKGSFFKLDFYDTNNSENQRLLLSVILPTQQGLKEPGFIGPPNNLVNVQVKKPNFVLDYTGADKEGFYIYWLKDKNYFPNNSFYVSAKFFNAKKGQFVRLINEPQSTFTGPNIFNVNKQVYFYYKYVLNYDTYEYVVYKETVSGGLSRVGTGLNPIKWYEYVNP